MYIYDDIKLIIENARAVPLLTPEKERDLAQKISQTRIDLWSHTLSYVALCPFMIDFALPELVAILNRGSIRRQADLSPIDDLKNHAEMERVKRSKNTFKNKRYKAAIVIADIDRGVKCFEKVRKELSKRRPFGRPSAPSNSNRFPDYISEIDKRLKIHRHLKEQFWRANIRLAISMTKKYDHGMIPFADMMQEGLIGLMTAVERFDHERELRFSTYATWWVRHSLNRFLANHGRTVRWPAHIVTDFEHLKQTRNKILNRGDRPTLEALAKESGIAFKRVKRILSLSTIQPIPMDSQIPGMDGISLADRICDDRLSIQEESPIFDPAYARIQSKIYDLPGIEADVLIKRFGLDGKDPRTLQEIAKDHSLSRERIRQLEKQGIDRLREVIRQ